VAGRIGNAPADAEVHVEILHPFRGDLSINLVAPDGTARVLKRARPRDGADNVIATYTVNLSSEALNGNWKLRVRDRTSGNTGHIDTWSITF
jgi:serine protease